LIFNLFVSFKGLGGSMS